MSKFIVSGFYDEVTPVWEEQLKLVKELKEEFICPRSVNGKNISDYTLERFKSEVLPLMEKYGVKISTIGSPYGKVGLNDEEGFQAQLNKLSETVKICKEIGCRYIRMFSFFVTSEYEAAKPEVIKKLKLMLSKVEGSDIILLHENEKGIYGNAPDRCLALFMRLIIPISAVLRRFQLCSMRL
jgi:sugar phosphate isomerase/epimerase